VIVCALPGRVGAAVGAGLLLAFPTAIRQGLVPALIGYAAGLLPGAALLHMITTALACCGCGHPAHRSWGAGSVPRSGGQWFEYRLGSQAVRRRRGGERPAALQDAGDQRRQRMHAVRNHRRGREAGGHSAAAWSSRGRRRSMVIDRT
jgi:hypothetical protein